MKVAIPIENNQLCSHFGHAKQFAFYQQDGAEFKLLETLTPPPHAPGVIPNWLAEQKIQVLVAGGIGGRAVDILKAKNIDVFQAQAHQEISEILADLHAKKLSDQIENCQHHEHSHDCN